uniref:Choline transporter-like protein n=1 Tax=Neogobius melanostomus TaxID=47308 RepID=A0A8C6T350_9GOBI
MGKKQSKSSPEESAEYGEPRQFDPNFKGPLLKRSCTDIICCILFVLVILGYLAVGILAWLYGDPRHVLYPKNSTGSFCGTGQNKDRPNLFYFDMIRCATSSFNILANPANGFQCPTTQVCVKECPRKFWGVGPLDLLKKPSEVFVNPELCVPYLNLNTTEVVNNELCPFYHTPLIPVFGRCMPDASALGNIPNWFDSNNIPGLPPSVNDTLDSIRNGTGDLVNGFNAKEIGIRIFEDFASSWPWILLGLLIAMVTSLLFLLLLRFIAPVMVWVLIVGLLGAGAYGIWHCYWEYDNYKKKSAFISDVGFSTDLKIYFQVQETWLAFLIVIAIGEAILLLMLIFLRKRILIAIALIQEASKAVSHMMSALVYPVITFIMLLICVAYWGATALYLATSGAPIYKVVALNSNNEACKKINASHLCDPLNFTSSSYPGCPTASCIFIKYNDEGNFQQFLFNLQIYNVICTLAGAFASYYWAFHKPADIPMFPICGSFLRALRYHIGSLAFGALILTLVQIMRMLLEYIDHKTREAQNGCARFILCCLKCCLWCLEKFIKFLNRNAYIMIAIYGKNFCVSAKNAFSLLMRNIIRVVVLDKVTDLLLFFGKLLVVGGVGVLAFFFFSGRIPSPNSTFRSETLNYYWMPIITVMFGSYLIAHGFFSVYNMCVDTLFLCFLEDLERNDGSAQKPYFMSKKLMKILNKKNK